MINPYNHYPLNNSMEISEKNLILEKYAFGSESELIDLYIAEGPSEVRRIRRISAPEWTFVFDYLVFEHDLLMKAVKASQDFFLDVYVKYGVDHVRSILDVRNSKYDVAFEAVFDYLAIAHDSLYRHLLENKEKYCRELKEKGMEYLKKTLGVVKPKYSAQWEVILNVMLFAYCENASIERNMEEGMKIFAKIYNAGRGRKGL